MKLKVLLEGKPFMTEYGIVGYSTVVFIACDDGKNILYDCGSKGCVLQLKEALEKAGITRHFENDNLQKTVEEIAAFVLSYNG